ncbi:tRNA1(Val) (adenine(37)-N6)-methyltransferase [Pseudoruegeria aquimaris]|uniref:tRNA1(Val) (Adenine(37)-N6)-methyltransferase n=1 Tax=Pseudoruegeria aquimaris TaxID=393663 RepID=A0A1Y5TNB4_9RHOB|nr:methyltransferase [Pseudoruegeria aquimaris]SLN68095.1 tRNA1(Val) (adenine(37)-N6)-methyltransferase [Pseudoruegeria aquimaris]
MTAADLTCDAFLGGRLSIWQPRKGYRAGVDPVLLAAAVDARPGQSVLELGCGAGVASLCLGARVPGLQLTGVEIQPFYAGLARRNAQQNGLGLAVHEADLARLPTELKARSFDHVIANPPYFLRSRGTEAPDAGRERAMGEATPLSDWLMAAARRLAPKGWLTLIQDAERLPDLLAAMPGALGSLSVLPLAAREGRPAHRILLKARKGGRAAFRLHPPILLHEGRAHQRDGEDYTAAISAVLRDGAALPLPG